ncbi:MAG: DUF1295 domain-containing protein [Bacteroidota bacterium]
MLIDHSLFTQVVWIWMISGLVLLPVLLNITAPYGRYTNSKWGPLLDNKLGWFVMESPTLLVFSYFFLSGSVTKNIVLWIFFGLWLFHYVYRVLIFPFRTKTGGKKMPVLIVLFAICFNFMNGWINGYFLGSFTMTYDITWLYDPRFILGVLLFFIGVYINRRSDTILFALRRSGDKGYKIPYGGMYKYVSCPNYMGEMIEWGGFALLTWSLPGLAFFVWTVVNLLPRAFSNHKWYRATFADYPKERKAVVPFIL